MLMLTVVAVNNEVVLFCWQALRVHLGQICVFNQLMLFSKFVNSVALEADGTGEGPSGGSSAGKAYGGHVRFSSK